MSKMCDERAINLLDNKVQPLHDREMFEAWKHLYDNDLLFGLENYYIQAFSDIVKDNEAEIGITIH